MLSLQGTHEALAHHWTAPAAFGLERDPGSGVDIGNPIGICGRGRPLVYGIHRQQFDIPAGVTGRW